VDTIRFVFDCDSTSSSSSYLFQVARKATKPIELATIKRQKENCKNEKYKKMILKYKKIYKRIHEIDTLTKDILDP